MGSEKSQNCSILEFDTRDGMWNAMCFHILLLWLKFHVNPSIFGTLFSRMKKCRIRIGSEKDQKYLFLEFDARDGVGNVIYWCDFIFCSSDSNVILIRALFSVGVLFDYALFSCFIEQKLRDHAWCQRFLCWSLTILSLADFWSFSGAIKNWMLLALQFLCPHLYFRFACSIPRLNVNV